MGKHEPLTNTQRAAKWRAAMRAKGLRPKQFWLPDTSDPAWKAEALRQSRIIGESEFEAEEQAFVDSISIWDELPE
jgi:hypothetical protein